MSRENSVENNPYQVMLPLQNHLIICGWKPEMDIMLQEIVQINSLETTKDIVIIAKVERSSWEAVMSRLPLQDRLHLIVDHPFSEKALWQANVREAGRVMILADWSKKETSSTETDTKTVMTAMTVERIAPEVYKMAELLDPAFAVYLKMACVDEVLYPREYSRMLLANSVSADGLGHVILELLDLKNPCKLATVKIPLELVGATFEKIYAYYDEQDDICIGLLEHTCNIHALKRDFLGEAHRLSDMRKMLDHLQLIRDIESNTPKLNPGADYVIKPHSLAVILRTQGSGL